jgi:hypothetical protein
MMSPRVLAASAALAALAVPTVAFGLFMSPSSVLQVVELHTGPRKIVVEGFASIPLQSATISVRGEGGMEGSTVENMKMKMDVRIDAKTGDDHGTAVIKMVAHQMKMYVQLAEVTGPWSNMQDIAGQWFVLDISKEVDRHEATLGEFVSVEHVNEQELRALIHQVQDAIFAMDWTLFDGGASYKLTLKPDLLFSLSDALCDQMPELDCALHGADSTSLRDDLEIVEIQNMLNEHLNVSYKVDTNRSDLLQFARMYVSIHWPETMDVGFQMSMHAQDGPVYVEVPKNARPIEELTTKWDHELMDLENDTVWEEDMNEWEDDTWDDEDWEWEEADLGETEQEPAYDQWEDVLFLPEGCNNEPGSLAYLRQARNGECPLPDDARPGRGARREQR